MWKQKIIDLGKIKPNSKNTIEFTYEGIKKVTDAKAGCGCTVSLIQDNVIHATYRSESLPAYKDNLQISKEITVTFDDNTKDIIYIKAIITNEIT